MTRPRSIIWFERLFCAAILLRLLNLYLGWSQFAAGLRADNPDLPAQAGFLFAGIGILLPLVLGWMAARRRKRFAALLILLWVAASIAFFAAQFVQGRFVLGPITLLGMMSLLLAGSATVLLFLAESRRWFSGRPGVSDLEREFS